MGDGPYPSVGPAIFEGRTSLGRLTRRPEFLAVATGRRFHTDRVTVQGRRRDGDNADPSGSADGLRVGLTLTKRVGHATERNRIRRRLRAAIRDAAEAHAATPADIVLVGRRDALSAGYGQLVADLARALPVVLKPKRASPRPDRSGTEADISPQRRDAGAQRCPEPRHG